MEKQILKALRKVLDPELRINVVDMGLIYQIKVKDCKALILMTLTSPSCPYGLVLKNSVKEAVKTIKAIKSITVKLTFTPLWNPERASKEAKFRLGLEGLN